MVKAGDIVGYEGNTGNSTGAHLHWMVELDGAFPNPRLFLADPRTNHRPVTGRSRAARSARASITT